MTFRRYGIAGAVVITALMAGCATTDAHRGRVVQPQVGTSYMDFTYVDVQGRSHRLGDHLGDFTVLVFTKCGGDMHSPMSGRLEDLVRVTQDVGVVHTIGYDIHWSEKGCSHGKSCHLIEQNDDLYSVCDARGIVRDLYSADSEAQLFVIGPHGKIIDSAPLNEFDKLKDRFRRTVQDYAAEKREAMPQEF